MSAFGIGMIHVPQFNQWGSLVWAVALWLASALAADNLASCSLIWYLVSRSLKLMLQIHLHCFIQSRRKQHNMSGGVINRFISGTCSACRSFHALLTGRTVVLATGAITSLISLACLVAFAVRDMSAPTYPSANIGDITFRF